MNNYSDWEKIGFIEGHGTTTEPRNTTYIDDISSIQSTSVAYRLKQIDFDGSFEFSDIVEVQLVPNAIQTFAELSKSFQSNYNNSILCS